MLMAHIDDHLGNGRESPIHIQARNLHEQRRTPQSHAESD